MLDIAVEAALGYHGIKARTMGYAERESSAAACLLARMEESSLEPAPIWCGDLESFPSDVYLGKVDGGIAGFPCPPVSCAGKRLGIADERWILPAIVNNFRKAGCEWLFLENVRGLLSANDGAAFGEVLRILAAGGFDAEWTMLQAAEVGASHERSRVFIVAHNQGGGCGKLREPPWRQRFAEQESGSVAIASGAGFQVGKQAREILQPTPKFSGAQMADPSKQHRPIQRCSPLERGRHGSKLADAEGERVLGGGSSEPEGRISETDTDRRGCEFFAPRPNGPWQEIIDSYPHLAPAIEPGVRVLDDGVAMVLDASRSDQLRSSGNGVVALQAACAFVELLRRFLDGQ